MASLANSENRMQMAGWRAVGLRMVPLMFMLLIATAHLAQAQTFNVIYNFPSRGGEPWSGPTMDQAGHLYGTTFYGGLGYGLVYELTRAGSGWIFTPLYNFTGGSDGGYPYAGVTIGPDGALYGTTFSGGGTECTFGCGTVYRLTPPATFCKNALCNWNETVLYRFSGGADGKAPYAGVIFDQAGNLYGTTISGGLSSCEGGFGCGVVYELTPSGGGWTETVLYSFAAGGDGNNPKASVVFDRSGNIYGTTVSGGQYNRGAVYQLTQSGSGWRESILHSFDGIDDGQTPVGTPIFDPAGNLYGATTDGGINGGGTIYELSPVGGGWTFGLLFSITAFPGGGGCYAKLLLDDAGDLYGTTPGAGPYRNGTAFELSPSDGGWTQTVLHNFTGGSDGEDLFGNMIFDSSGNLYGTASLGGAHGAGVVFEITP
jgi:uncharacterized repeat protein (TIGR03803 family)